MPKEIIVVGASAGGIEALRALAAGLPEEFAASVFVVLHTSAQSPGLLAEILDRAGPLPATRPRDGERIQPGRIYVTPPDRHLLVEPGVVPSPTGRGRTASARPLTRSSARRRRPTGLGSSASS